jgi:hypothetical protein
VRFEIGKMDFPVIVVMDLKGNRYFKLKNAGNLNEVEKWIEGFDRDSNEREFVKLNSPKKGELKGRKWLAPKMKK